MIEGEEEKIDPTPIREENTAPIKGSRVKEVCRSGEVAVTEGGDEEIQRNLQQKLQDPREFIVPCAIGGQIVGKVICNSGARMNVMPSSLYKKLGLSRMKPTELILQLTDKLFKVPLGFLEDVEVQIDKLRLPVDFMVLDIENNQNFRVILGQPLFATVAAVIDVK
ncbi:uncharacterized protein LOC142550131 [Primulina tabacum]|uniref:uncharacterized protein LOC142550131 n=1 Tax=Primulina tabacum TaxID=48773 RepID=UPI003F5928A8